MHRRETACSGRFGLFMFMALSSLVNLRAQEEKLQILEPDPRTQTTRGGEAVSVDFYYSTQPLDRELPGLALRLHFNSDVLRLTGFTNVLPGVFAIGGEPEVDADDLDGDPATGALTRLMWVDSLERNWPGTERSSPVRLFTANFEVLSTFTARSEVRISAISTAAGHELRARPAIIAPEMFRRSDVNDDGVRDISDVVSILNIVVSGRECTCKKAADANDDGFIDVSDAIFLLRYVFGGKGEPPAPWVECGEDPTPDALTCDAFKFCDAG